MPNDKKSESQKNLSGSFILRGDEAVKKKNYEYAISTYVESLKLRPDDGETRKKLFTACRERKRSGQAKAGPLDRIVYLPRKTAMGALVGALPIVFVLWILLPGMSVPEGAGPDAPAEGLPLDWIVCLLGVAAAGALAFLSPWPNLLLLSKRGRAKEAFARASALLLKDPERLDLLDFQAHAAAEAGYPEAAIAIAENVLSMVPSHVPTLKLLGQLYHQHRKDIQKAQSCYNKILHVAPADIEASRAVKNLAAERTLEQGVEKAAVTDDYRAMLKDQKGSERLEAQQRVLKTSDEFEQALQFKKEELAQKPGEWRLWRDLGDLQIRLKAWTEAEASYRKAIELEPVNPTLKMSLGNLTLKHFDEQLLTLREALKAQPADAAAKARHAQLEKERLAFSLEEFARRAQDLPTDPNVRYDYGEALFRSGKTREAISEFQFSVKDPKRKVPSLLRLGECFRREGQLDLSAKQFEKALEDLATMNDTRKAALYALGDVYEKQARLEDAKKAWGELYEADINFKDVSKRLEKLKG